MLKNQKMKRLGFLLFAFLLGCAVSAWVDAEAGSPHFKQIVTTPSPSLSAMTRQESGPLTWVRTGGPPGGLGYDIRYNFDNPTTWYATDSYAGVHISTDNGLTWLPSNNGIPAQSGQSGDAIPIFCLTVDPHDPQIIWTGTNGTGHIYRSTDGGLNWKNRENGIVMEWQGGLSFRGFTVDPRTSDIVYAMGETSDPLTGSGVSGEGTGGVVYKTTDGGANWSKIWDGGIPSSLARYLWINPQNPDILYVSTGIFDRRAVGEGDFDTDPFGGLGILRSHDGGQTWEVLDEQNGLEMLYIGSLFMHPENPDILLAAAGHVTPGTYTELLSSAGHTPVGIYRTANGGDSWTQVFEPPLTRAGEAFTSVELCPSDPDIGYAGSEYAVYRTDDAGQTWELVAGGTQPWGPPGITAGWPIDMQCDASDPDRVFANNYNGGNFLSEDGGRTWKNASQGYTGAQMRRVNASPQYPGRVYAAGRSGIWRADDGTKWAGIFYPPAGSSSVTGIEWQSIAVDPLQPDHVIASKGYTMQSFDGGETWQDVTWQDAPASLPFIYQIEFAPSDARILYAIGGNETCLYGDEIASDGCPRSGAGVFTSRDGGSTWARAVDDNLRDISPLGLAIDPENADVAYVSTTFGLFKTTNGGGVWSKLDGLTDDSPVRAVAVHPGDGNIVLAALRGVGIFLSRDAGQTWQTAYNGLETNTSMSDIVFDPADPLVVYAGDLKSGVYHSTDGGQTWQKLNNGLRMRAVVDLSISADGKHLYAATDGEGVYRLDVDGQSPPSASPPEDTDDETPSTDPSGNDDSEQPPSSDSTSDGGGGGGGCFISALR